MVAAIEADPVLDNLDIAGYQDGRDQGPTRVAEGLSALIPSS